MFFRKNANYLAYRLYRHDYPAMFPVIITYTHVENITKSLKPSFIPH